MTHKPTGWNTWDFRGFNRFSCLDKGKLTFSLYYAIWDEQVPPPEPKSRKLGELYEILRWENATRLGPHAPLGLPAELDFEVTGTPFRASAFEKDGVFHLNVKPLADTHKRIVFVLDSPDGAYLDRSTPREGTFAGYSLSLENATWPTDYFVNIAKPYAIGPAGWGVSMTIAPTKKKTNATDPDGTLEHYQETTLTGSGSLENAPQAMTTAVLWNTLYDLRRQFVSSPVSRDWCYDWRGVLVFCWDTYLVGSFISYASPQLAKYNFETVCAAIDEMGHVPNYYMAHGAASRDRSMPPLGSYMILKTQRLNPDKKWLGKVFKQLCTWHEYWMANRDGNGNGLLSWGSNAEPEYEFPQLTPYNGVLRHNKQSAQYESGLDNSPLFDEADFNEEANCIELDDVALSSFFAMDCECLAIIADLLGKKSAAKRYRVQYETIKQKINDLLWDEQAGIYCNRHWDGRLSKRWAPTSFFPMIAGVATPERAERMVKEHLLNPDEFWGQYVIPSISRTDPAYPDNDYWRGRIWGPFNYLVSEGLRRYRMDDVASELATKSVNLFMENWNKDGGVYENYNADTGEGADVWNAARLYHWGGLLAFMGMQELIDVEPAGYLRLGSLDFAAGGLNNVQIGKDRFEVAMDSGLKVMQNGKVLLESPTRVIVRLPLDDSRPIQITGSETGEVSVCSNMANGKSACVNGLTTVKPVDNNAMIRYCW